MTDTKTPETPVDAATAEIVDLKAKLADAEAKRDEYLALARQTRADFENYQKRAQRDRETERRYAQMPLAGEILPALDNLERALDAARTAGDDGPLVKGVSLVLAQFLDLMKRHGVTVVEAQGAAFDPNLHQAVMQQPSETVPANHVLAVLQQGYQIHERVLRPASVIVSTGA